ncbi:MAG: LytTR family transcriptional regulator DNA-binding domain-containing protein, partial [Oscillospiraceae bacterium]|nr:LytTR family transcriptional regulator DNA-binding domain-containing protein [Oscillospiraceae bacterium]
DKLREYYPTECETKKYTDGKKLLEDSKSEYFDAFFLDVGMPIIDGFEIARQIRSNDSGVKIIFVTRKEELAHLGYMYNAFRFVRKSRLDQELCEAAKSLSESFSLSDEYLYFRSWTGDILINIKTIRYFKADGHSLILHGLKEERVYGTMQELEERLKKMGFIRIHKSYLVNFRYFYSLESKSVTLTNGEELPISRNRILEVKKIINKCSHLEIDCDLSVRNGEISTESTVKTFS